MTTEVEVPFAERVAVIECRKYELAWKLGYIGLDQLDALTVKELFALAAGAKVAIRAETDIYAVPITFSPEEGKAVIGAAIDVWDKYGTFYEQDWTEALGIAPDDWQARDRALHILRCVGAVPTQRRPRKVEKEREKAARRKMKKVAA